MKKVLLLFKKDVRDFFSFKRSGRKRDIVGMISSILLLCLIYGVFIYVFLKFADMYLGTTFADPTVGFDRAYEIMTFVLGGVVVIDVVVGVRSIYSSVSLSRDCDVLMCQPISARAIFFYKLINIYRSQVISSVLILLPLSIIVDVLSPYAGGAGYYVATVASVFLVPLISCALASLLSIPYTIVMRFIDSKFILHLIIYTAIIGLGFWLYSLFLNTLTGLLRSGEIEYVFDLNTITKMNGVALHLFPANLYANMLFGVKAWQSVLILLAVSVGASAITFFVIQTMYNRLLQLKMEGQLKVYNNKPIYKKRSIPAALLYKEFLMVLRTPSYAFQYFATAVTLPFMVYVCVNLMRSMMSTLTVVDCDYELSVFVVSMFCILTNTFCSTNISRDGKMFAMLKTMPVKCTDIILTKLIFCGIVSLVSVLASCVVLAAVGFLNAWQTIFVFVMGMMLSLAEIAYATRKDLANPNFPAGDRDDEVTESNSNVSTVMIIGLGVSILAGGGSLAVSTLIGILSSAKYATLAAVAIVLVVVVTVFFLAFLYLFKGLKAKYYNPKA